MASEVKPVRKVRFNLPETKNVQSSNEQKPYEGRRRASDSALKRSTVLTTPSIIVNKNATSFNNNKKKANENAGFKMLPKIPERPKVAKTGAENKQIKLKASSAKPRAIMTRSQSLSCKRALSDVPSVEITEMDYPAVVAFPHFAGVSDLNLLKAPLPEDDNSNYLTHGRNLEKDTHGVLKGTFSLFLAIVLQSLSIF